MEVPVGYYKFHKNKFLNYQMNRSYSLGNIPKEELDYAASRIRTFSDYIREFKTLAEKALSENRLKHAAFYYRSSEFLAEPGSHEKAELYKNFIEIFDQAFKYGHYQREKLPYQDSFLSCLRFPARNYSSKGVVLAIGGFDSFIEEFFCIWDFLAENGYELIAFEGPGQGSSLRRYGLSFDHDWEKPVSEILDYFEINQAALLGLSMGGYWVIRAAAFEKRIDRILALPPVYDWLELTNSFNKKLVDILLKFPDIFNFMVRLKMKSPALRHTINHALYINDYQEPIDAVRWMLAMNKKHIHSELVNQKVLLMGGENDAFQPPKLLYKQKEALINADSVDVRIFKEYENADQHCQIGNVGLLREEILRWLDA